MSPKYHRVLVIPVVIFLAMLALLLFACELPESPIVTSTPTLGVCNELNRETLYPLTPTPVPSATVTVSQTLELFWEIRAEVNCGEIRVYKDISIWAIDRPQLHRIWRGIEPFQVGRVPLQPDDQIPLNPGSCVLVGNNNELRAENGRIVFNGGYIKCQDWELQTQVPRLSGYDITQVVNGFAFEGKDVNLQTEIKLQPNVNHHSIMFYPQSDSSGISLGGSEGVELWIEGPGTITNPIKFEIDRIQSIHLPTNSMYTPTYSLGLNGWHDLRVREHGYDPQKRPIQFGMLVDNIGFTPILSGTWSNQPHYFALGNPPNLPSYPPIYFYIGYHPGFPNEVFRGEMSYFIFNPNDSCGGCGGGG